VTLVLDDQASVFTTRGSGPDTKDYPMLHFAGFLHLRFDQGGRGVMRPKWKRAIPALLVVAALANLMTVQTAWAQADTGTGQSESKPESEPKKQGGDGTHPTDKLANQATNPGAALI
jgi:hypothetical protein